MNKVYPARSIIILLILAVPLMGQVNKNKDVQLWLTEAKNIGMGEKFNLYLSNQWRFGDDISRLYFVYLEGLLGIQWTDRIEIMPGYRQVWRLDLSRKWRLAYEPIIDLIFHKGRVFQVRNRISYLAHEKSKNVWQYRARIRLDSESWTYNLFFYNEIFVLSHFGFTQNRTGLGVSVPLFCWVNADLSYMLRFLKSEGSWTHQHIFGAWFNLDF